MGGGLLFTSLGVALLVRILSVSTSDLGCHGWLGTGWSVGWGLVGGLVGGCGAGEVFCLSYSTIFLLIVCIILIYVKVQFRCFYCH